MNAKWTVFGMARAAVAMALLALASLGAQAQAPYPNKPIRMIMPFAPGSGFDTIVRFTAEKLSKELGQQVVVENMPGAGGIIASQHVARANPDGYTLIFHSVSSAVVIAKAYTNLRYDPASFAPVSFISQYPLAMVANPQLPATNIKEFIALAKANPGKYAYGSSGVGTGIHLAGELFKMQAGVDLIHVPYKGTAGATADLLAGRIHVMFEAVPSSVGRVSTGQVRALAVTTTKRSFALPDVPTLQEAGLKDFDIPFWNGIFAPGGTPKAIIDKLSAACAKVVRDPATIAKFKELGAEGVGSTAEDLDRFWKQQLALYGKVVEASGVKLEAQ
ncbi:MAG TPA: tripartite tricarboxylate transporter substrate binding protein [Usitatibacter sp.]|nr:tripartite tricarboxylate transporter substrate binding protein [Usitatibacter sp.]